MSRRVAMILAALCLALPWSAPAQDTTKDEIARLRQEVVQLSKQVSDTVQKLEVQKLGLEKSEREVKQLREQLAAQAKQAVEQSRVIAELRRQLVEAQLQVHTLRERNQQLLADQQARAKAFQKMRDALGELPKAPERNPPPAEVEGSVTAVAEAGGYLTLNLGSDSGLKAGHTLEVFRLKPDAKYLGTVRVIDVRAKETLAKPVGKPAAVIQVGDRVASRIQ